MLSRQEILQYIAIARGQQSVARQRKEYDVVAYHQRQIDDLMRQLQSAQ